MRTSRSVRPSGFTLIELLVVIAIIAILSVIGIASFATASRSARDGKRKGDLSQVRAALELYRSQFNAYPAGPYNSMTSTLSTNQYLAAPLPQDPKNAAPYQYTYTVAGTTFCLCARLENSGTGNSSGSCAGTSGDFVCMTQP